MNQRTRIQKRIIIFGILCAFTEICFAQSNLDRLLGSSAKYQNIIVIKVISADTFVIEGGEKIKLIGMRAPERPKEKKNIKRDQFGFAIKKREEPVKSIEERSIEFVKELLEGETIRLEFDAEKKNSEYTTLAYAFLLKDDIFVNSEILRRGYAHLQIRPPNTKYAKQLREAYREARREKRGLQNQ